VRRLERRASFLQSAGNGFRDPSLSARPAGFAMKITWLWISYGLLFIGELTAWWIPYLFHSQPERAARYQAMFGATHAFLPAETERLAYSIQESADLLGVDYFSVYRLIQRGKLRACRALRGKLLVPRTELLRLLKS
jgi:excisionase family DNA binding protein